MKCLRKARLDAVSADEASFSREEMLVIEHLVGGVWASCDARTACNTPIGVVLDLEVWAPPFRVMTPETAQSASLQKNGGADARAVMYGEALNVKDCSSGFHEMLLLSVTASVFHLRRTR